jgi:hypothetical protein
MTYWTESTQAMTTKERVQYIYNRLRAKNLTDTEARAMLANIEVETGGSFDPAQLQKGSRKDPAFGLFQFDPRGLGLAKPYFEYVESREDKDPYSIDNQIDFMAESITGEYAPGAKYIGAGNIIKFREAAEEGLTPAIRQFSGGKGTGIQGILNPGVPHMNRREKAASNIDTLLKDMPTGGIVVELTSGEPTEEMTKPSELRGDKSFLNTFMDDIVNRFR